MALLHASSLFLHCSFCVPKGTCGDWSSRREGASSNTGYPHEKITIESSASLRCNSEIFLVVSWFVLSEFQNNQVDIRKLAELTKNFSGAELRGLVSQTDIAEQ